MGCGVVEKGDIGCGVVLCVYREDRWLKGGWGRSRFTEVELYLGKDGIWCWFSVRVNMCALDGECCRRVKVVSVCV